MKIKGKLQSREVKRQNKWKEIIQNPEIFSTSFTANASDHEKIKHLIRNYGNPFSLRHKIWMHVSGAQKKKDNWNQNSQSGI